MSPENAGPETRMWRKRVRVEHTHDAAKAPRTGFEVEAFSGRDPEAERSEAEGGEPAAEILSGSEGTLWRKRVRVEHTHDAAKAPRTGFEVEAFGRDPEAERSEAEGGSPLPKS
jgi:hypothetical protein